MKKKKVLGRFFMFLGFLVFIAGILSYIERARVKMIVGNVRAVRRGEKKYLSLSNYSTRILTKNNEQSEHAFRNLMNGKGWDFICYYGRSALYRQKDREVLVRKTGMPGGLNLYELMDENYFKSLRKAE